MPAADLQAAIANIDKIIKDLTANPKPSYSIGERSVSWSDYLSMLIDKREALQKLIQQAGHPFTVISKGQA